MLSINPDSKLIQAVIQALYIQYTDNDLRDPVESQGIVNKIYVVITPGIKMEAL